MSNYVDDFKKILDLSSDDNQSLKESVEKDTEEIEKRKESLDKEPFPKEALKTILLIVASRSYYYNGTYNELNGNENGELTKLEKEGKTLDIDFYESDTAISIFKKYENRRNPIADNVKKLIEQIREARSIRNWLNDLHSNRMQHAKINDIKGLGEKGRNEILRDMGYFDCVPIDKHQIRFLLRTGIFHIYSSKDSNPDTEKRKYFEDAFKKFCEKELRDVCIKDKKLSETPGIADIVVWKLCSRFAKYGGLNICASKPNCAKCPMNKSSCWFSKYNIDLSE